MIVWMTRAYALGLFFIVLVALIWAASSILVQFLYSDPSFDSPFFVTYVGVSLFSLWLPTHMLTHRWTQKSSCCASQELPPGPLHSSANSGHGHRYHDVPQSCDGEDDHQASGHLHHDDDHHGHSNHSQEREESAVQLPLSLEIATTPWTHWQHFRAALMIAPVWFIANWAYNTSLKLTSITSSTVLSSTGSLFTFLFAVLTRDEPFSWMKLGGVMAGFAGSLLTALHDTHQDAPSHNQKSLLLPCSLLNSTAVCPPGLGSDPMTARDSLMGDILGLISALGYGCYAVQTRLLCPHDESLYSMQLVLGYIGLVNMVSLSPLALYFLWKGGPTGTGVVIPWTVLGFLVMKSLFDDVLSDYLWLRAVILTNATVATVGLGLTIPLAFFTDMLVFHKGGVVTVESVLGALAVLAGFVLVNYGHHHPESSPVIHAAELAPLPEAASELEPLPRDTSVCDGQGAKE